MKERLIEILQNHDYYAHCERCTRYIKVCESCRDERLANLLIENGVIVPPVKVRQKVWVIGYTGTFVKKIPCMVEGEVYTITISELNYEIRGVFECRAEINGECEWFNLLFDDFGKTVFLTKEEAEKALAERSDA